MKFGVNTAAILETSPQVHASAHTVMSAAWIASSWRVEPLLCSPRHADEHRLADDKLMNHANEHPGSSLCLFDPDPALVYSIGEVERLTRVPRRMILLYCRHGLVSPLTDPEFGGYYFNREAIRVLRRIGYLQLTHGVNVAGIKFILDLADEVQRLRITLAMYPPPTPSKSKEKRYYVEGPRIPNPA